MANSDFSHLLCSYLSPFGSIETAVSDDEDETDFTYIGIAALAIIFLLGGGITTYAYSTQSLCFTKTTDSEKDKKIHTATSKDNLMMEDKAPAAADGDEEEYKWNQGGPEDEQV